jgi:CRP/FNR family cyclic AMP-dependent transcriptional regulator
VLEARQTKPVAVLKADPDLGARLGAQDLARAVRPSLASTLRRDPGMWDAAQDAEHGRDGLGLLVLEGTLMRRVGMRERFAAELLGPGDILQPAAHDGEEAMLPFETRWRILSRLNLAVLDLRWMERMAPFPAVTAEITARVMVRSRRMAVMFAIAQHPRLTDRLRLFFWDLADRYGRVRPDGVLLELELTQEMIGHLVGGRRPSVSKALSELEGDGLIRRDRGRLLLLGDPPKLDAFDGAGPDGR